MDTFLPFLRVLTLPTFWLGLGREKGYTSRLKFILITIKEAKSNVAQFVYTMHRVGKVVPPKRHILKNISLSFFPGAKIGVLGLNGAGKSTLLRIMAASIQTSKVKPVRSLASRSATCRRNLS